MIQNQLDIELREKSEKQMWDRIERNAQFRKSQIDAIDATSIKTGQIHAEQVKVRYGAGIGNRQVDEYDYSYNCIIGGDYASIGGYEHLVGKDAKIIETMEDLEVHVVKPREEEKTYVIRMKDIKLK